MSLNKDAFSSELLELISRKLNDTVNSRDNYKEVMKNLLFPSLRIYSYKAPLGNRFFHEVEDLICFLERHSDKSGRVCAIEYLEDAFGSQDVIRIVNPDGSFKICTFKDEESYAVLNLDMYFKTGAIVWGIEFGSLREEVVSLMTAGAKFESDVFLERGDLFARFKTYANDVVKGPAKYKMVPKKEDN